MTAAREFMEELRNRVDFDIHGPAGYTVLKDDGSNSEFNILFRRRYNDRLIVQFHLLGVGIDPVSTKPEFLLAAVMDWKQASIRLPDIRLLNNYEGKLHVVRFRDGVEARKEQLRCEAVGFVHSLPSGPLPTLAAGAACFMLGAQHYERLMQT